MEVKKNRQTYQDHLLRRSRIPHDDQYLFGDSLVTIFVAELKDAM